MALADETAKTTRNLEIGVIADATILLPADPTTAAGSPGVISVMVTKNLDAPVPVASIGLNRISDWLIRGKRILVTLGYNGQGRTVFTGTVQDRADGVEVSYLNCVGNLWKLFRGIEIAERTVDGLNVKVAIESILDDVGITSSFRDTANIPTGFSLGSASDAKLQRQRSSQMVQSLMDLEGVRVYEDGNGVAQFKVIDGTPASGAFKTFTTDTTATARIIGGGVREDPSYTRTKVTVRGATIVEGTAPDTTARTVEQVATMTDRGQINALIKPNLEVGQHIEAEFSSSLIDTDAKALDVAKRLGVQFARIPKSVTVSIPGDPELELAQTISVDWPELNVTGNWFIYGITHIVDGDGYRTELDLRGGEEYGVNIGIGPVASFVSPPLIEREVYADRVQAVVTFDASNSYDPDGASVTYAWSDNQTTSPDIAGLTTAIITVRIDPGAISGTWTVTLTVTDADGLTASFVVDVDVTETASTVEIPAIYAAIDVRESATPDGGLNWNDQTDAGVISVGARPDDGVTFGHAIFGTSDGKLLRTTDSCASALTEVHDAGAVRIETVAWDWRDPSRVWALDDDLVLYWSQDGGATWAVYDDVGAKLGYGSSIGKSIGLPGAGGVWVYGGTGANNPLIAYARRVGQHNWREISFGGHLASDLAASAADIAIVDAVDKGDGSGMVIVMENADAGNANVRPVYHTSSPFTPDDWERGTGFAVGDTESAFVVGAVGDGGGATLTDFLMAFHDRSTWVSVDGVVWTKNADVLDANFQFNHAIWGFAHTHNFLLNNFHLAAVEDTAGQTEGIFKSTDEGASWGLLRPATGYDTWPASAIGRQVAIGRSQASEARFVVCADDAANAKVAWRSSSVAWTTFDTSNFNGVGSPLDLFRVRALTDQLWFVLGWDSDASLDSGEAIRTEDGGSSWDDLYAAPADGGDTRLWQDFAMASDGTLWGLTINFTTGSPWNHVEIWKSTDDGDNWTESYDSQVATYRPRFLVAHPTDPDRIAAYGTHDTSHRQPLVIFSIDGGDNWNVNAYGSNLFHTSKHVQDQDIKQLNSLPGRLITSNISGADSEAFWTSDDMGATWDKRTEVSGLSLGTNRFHSIVGEPGGVGLYSTIETDTSPTKNEIWASYDGGATWADIGNDVPVLHSSHRVRNGLAYDPVEKALYTWGTGGSWAPNTDHVWKLFPVTASGTWTDVSGALLPWDGDASYGSGDPSSHGIAVIPRP